MKPLRPLPDKPLPAHPYYARIWANDDGEIFHFASICEAVEHFLDHETEPDRAVLWGDDGKAKEWSAQLCTLIRDAAREADEWERHVEIESAKVRAL
jgi:hypothetical protein